MSRFAAFVLLFPSIVCAVDLYVPDDFVVIQDAIDAANEGDVVIVRDGVWTGFFNKDLDFNGKAITVRSENGPENCIIDCEGNGRGFWFHLTEPAEAVLEGFTIRNSGSSGAIKVDSSHPTIRNCVITDSQSIGMEIMLGNSHVSDCRIVDGLDTGVRTRARPGGGTEFARCVISGNTGTGPFGSPGGIEVIGFSNDGVTVFRNCLIVHNTSNSGGGGLVLWHDTVLTGCTVAYNVANGQGGAIKSFSSNVTVRSCILWGNTPINSQVDVAGGVPPMIRYSNIEGGYNGLGNIDEDPMFVDEFHLGGNSPCIDSGDPDFVPEPDETDLDGDPRVVNGRVDMGADEFTDFGVCGNGIVEAGEECDPPDGTTCDETCRLINDVDGDGVLDEDDVCNNTPLAIPVDATGRPVGDIDLDCDVDLSDFAALQGSFTGPLE